MLSRLAPLYDAQTINIKGVGPQTALKLIKDYGTIKSALAHMKKEGKLPSVNTAALSFGTLCHPADPSAHMLLCSCLSLSESTENEFNYTGAAELFRNPEVTDPKAVKLEWKVSHCLLVWCCATLLPPVAHAFLTFLCAPCSQDPDEEGLVQFLVTEKGFDLARVQGALKRLKGARAKASQQRIDGMFRVPKPIAAAADSAASSSAAAASSSSSGGGIGSFFGGSSSASSTPAAYLDGPPPGIVYEKPNAKRKAEEAAKGSQKKGPGGLVKKAKTKEAKAADAKASAKKKK